MDVLQVESIIGAHVFDLQTEKYLGKITHPIIDYQAQKVLGFIFKRTFYSPPKAFVFSAIKKVGGDFAIIDKTKAKFFFRARTLRKAFKKQRQVMMLKLVEDGKQVGTVIDFGIDEDTGSIKNLVAEKSLFSDVFKIPISKVKEFAVDAYVLEEDAIPQEEKEKPSIFTRILVGAGKKIGSAAKQSKQLYSEGQKNMLVGQVSPCNILSSDKEILLAQGQTITEEILQRIAVEKKLGELTSAMVGSGIGTKYKSYKAQKKKKALQADKSGKDQLNH